MPKKSKLKASKDDIIRRLPNQWPEDLLPQIEEMVKGLGSKVAVLDDDPTGTQTVHGIPILTRWDFPSICKILREPGDLFFLLTNSRAYPLAEAVSINREIIGLLKQASLFTGRPISIISRSDSTLRGHFPGEVDVLVEELGGIVNGILIIPFFEEGGRLTVDNIHYVVEEDSLVPVGETEYARDISFGYQSSNLCQWVREKSQGRVLLEDVASISLETIRLGGPDAVRQELQNLKNNQFCVVNAVSYADLEVLVYGLLKAEAEGQRFIFRTAASFVRVRAGMHQSPLLTASRLGIQRNAGGGLVVAGSYVGRSTEQILAAQSLPDMISLEVEVTRIINPATQQQEIQRVAEKMNESIADNRDVLIYTSRQLITDSDPLQTQKIGRTVSKALVKIVQLLDRKPGWVVAKGGITSADIAAKGLQIVRAEVLGQVLQGVPVWQSVSNSRWPELIYVVFPGNVGDSQALAKVINCLRGNDLETSDVF